MCSICRTFYPLSKADRTETFDKSHLHRNGSAGFARKNIACAEIRCRIEVQK